MTSKVQKTSEDNALRWGEIEKLTIGDFERPRLWTLGKGKAAFVVGYTDDL